MRDFELLRTPRRRSEVDEQREHRRFTAEQKLEILKEADQPGVTVSAEAVREEILSSFQLLFTDDATEDALDYTKATGKANSDQCEFAPATGGGF